MARRRAHYAIALVAFGLTAALGAAVSWWRQPVDLSPWREGAPPRPWAAWQREEEVWREQGVRRSIRHAYVALDDIPEEVQVAVLVSEDLGFFGHGAVDLASIREALAEWWRGSRLRGASTISQQLARTLFLSGERTLSRKLEEARLASALERHLGKRRILELYLNVVEFAPGVFGVEAAASHYFDLPVARLDASQAAGLAAAIPSPSRDNPETQSRRWQARRSVILARMARVEWLRLRLRALRAATSGGR